MDSIGVAHTRRCGCAMLDILAMVAMEIGLEDPESWKSPKIPFPSSHGLERKMARYIVRSFYSCRYWFCYMNIRSVPKQTSDRALVFS